MDQDKADSIAIIRVSSIKQVTAGDSPTDQKESIDKKALSLGITTIKYFETTMSASGEFQPSQAAIDYCKNKKVKYCFIRCIDRFTRGGAYFYIQLKNQLDKYGVQLIDAAGIINPETINTLDHLGVEFKWSKYQPSYRDEILEAEDAKSEVRRILTRMIGAEIRYSRMGYWIGPSPMGYQSKKLETSDDGIRVVLEPHTIESPWFVRMFELRAEGIMSDEEIVKEINLMGYKSRRTKRHQQINNKREIVGFKGEIPLDVKQLQRYISMPVYAGINVRKWTEGKPIKHKFEGLVTIDLFNKANKGTLTIVEEDTNISIYRGKAPQPYNAENPLYAFKHQVVCPICKHRLIGSASTGKSGQKFPAYHCSRTHKSFRVPLKDFNIAIESFVKNVKMTDKFKMKLRELVAKSLERKREELIDKSLSVNKQIENKVSEQKLLVEKIKVLSSPVAIQSLETEVEKLEQDRLALIYARDKGEPEQADIQKLINSFWYYIEHFEELVLGQANPHHNALFFGLLFEVVPTYQELVDGTPRLECLFELNRQYNNTQIPVCEPGGI